ncbi:MAG: PadR family transcriptional regulator [Candidatus Binatia bacterium]
MFRFLILGLLRSGVPLHGYALVKEYRERSGADVSTGNFYRELQRLVLDGLIQSTENPPDADARRTPYAITPVGVRAFDDWLSASDLAFSGFSEDELSARALFVEDAPPEAVLQLLDRLQENTWLAGKALERARLTVANSPAPAQSGRRFRALPLLLSRRLKRTAADAEFLEELRKAYVAHRAALAAAAAPPPAPAAPARLGPARKGPSPAPPAAPRRRA